MNILEEIQDTELFKTLSGSNEVKKEEPEKIYNSDVDDDDIEVAGEDSEVDESDIDSEYSDKDDDNNLDVSKIDITKMPNENSDNEYDDNENDDSEDDDSEDDDEYLQKFNKDMRNDLISNFHPEAKSNNYEEIKQLAKVIRNKNGIIVDELHKTIPMLTKYEKTRILGQRAKQIETGAMTLVQVPPNIIDSYLIAKLELEQNKIPFIIRRPLPNGGMEYWYVSDLDNI